MSDPRQAEIDAALDSLAQQWVSITTELTRLRELRDAVRDAVTFPMHTYDMDGYPVCVHCKVARKTREPWIVHAPDCAGVRIATLLAALDGK